MSSEREIVQRLYESRDLDESSFEANGKTYKCAFGKYYCDGEQISREDYFKARDGKSNTSSVPKTSKVGLTFEDVQKLAKDNYKDGGDSFYETWDKDQFEDYVKEYGPMSKEDALKLFSTYKGTEDHPEDSESEYTQSTERFLNANPHYDMFDDNDYDEQVDQYIFAIEDIEDTFKVSGDDDKRKNAYEKLSKKLDGFEKNAPKSYAKQIAKLRSKLVSESPYDRYTAEQFDDELTDLEDSIDNLIDDIKYTDPDDRDYKHGSDVDELLDKLRAIEDHYLTDEQYARRDDLMYKLSNALEDTEYDDGYDDYMDQEYHARRDEY